MRNIFRLLYISCTILLLSSCSNNNDIVKEARELIANDKAKCILIQNNKIVATYNGKGVSPLLEVYRKNSEAMKDGIIVDKVIGRAAAFIVIKGKAGQVYTPLLSEDAKKLLEEHNIKVEYDKLVPKILNRNQDGLCPLEASVLGETDPVVALDKIQKQIETLMKGNK